MDHSDLMAELPIIEKLTPAERIQLARERRALQLLKRRERDRTEELEPPPPKTERVKFRPGIALLEATARNDIEEVRSLLAQGANPNSHNEDGLTPLHQCAIDNNVDILLLLLENGADVNAKDTELWTPLHAAACCAHVEVVGHLISKGANLLAVNADGNMPYDICDEDGTLDVIESEMARRGITQDDIDEERGSGEKQMLADMKWLYQHGASLDYRDLDGATPLHVGSSNGYYDVVAFLLRCGVSPTVKDDDSWQPIHAAACWAQPDIIELLDEYGADISAKTDAGETALDLCEDETTRTVIMTLQAEKARRRRMAFPRDSRRYSKKRKSSSKFESPNAQISPPSDSPFSARGAIRRLSLRDRSGVTLARIEARKEAALMRSWSLEDTSQQATENGGAIDDKNGSAKPDSPKKSKKSGGLSKVGKQDSETGKSSKNKRGGERPKPMSPDEWLKKLEDEEKEDVKKVPEAPKRAKPTKRPKGSKSSRETSSSSKKETLDGGKKTEETPLVSEDNKSASTEEAGNSASANNSSAVNQGRKQRKEKDLGKMNGPNGVASGNQVSSDGEPKKFRDDTVVGGHGRAKRFMCCAIV